MSGMPNWLMPVALGASLLVNLGLGGYVAGQHLRPDAPVKERPDRRPEFERPEGIPELPREDRREIRQLMRQGFDSAQAELSARREAEQRFASTLLAEPYDRAAAEAALRDLRDADVRLRDKIGMEVLGGVESLTPDQRAWVAWILSGPKEGHHGKHKKKDKGEGPENGPQPD